MMRVLKQFLFFPALCACVFFCSCQKKTVEDQVCSPRKCFRVEIADNDFSRQIGLQDRSFLPQGQGMLFIFTKSRNLSFWMKDTLIPLDIIWIDHTRRVVHIEQDVPPCKADPCLSYTPLKSALYALELNAGAAKKYGIKVGTELEFRLEKYLKK